MMYAFGDDVDPLPETVMVLEEILIDYLTELVSNSRNLVKRISL